ncbi:hypothetical protein [Thermospira aquatica]|uniref:Lipoprotein n=1 Tax=Thermospira aquatica TaxID=2828656 RepID=A0AAX3BEQ6_9SPIR|nr:hypothetical protein [Thermospira aquatica]URA10598.1 hypothetical protein KDW03_01995 [Thermospira aquatica]
MLIRRITTTLLFLMYLFSLSSCEKEGKGKVEEREEFQKELTTDLPGVEWRYGVAFIKGKPAYFSPVKMEEAEVDLELYLSYEYIKRECSKSPTNIVVTTEVGFLDNIQAIVLTKEIYDTNGNWVDMLFEPTLDPELYFQQHGLFYRISNQAMYLSKDKTNWSKLKMRVVSDKVTYYDIDPENPSLGKYAVYMILYLECDWFKGEYEVEEYATPG